jgi:4-amino-4-deoxy-L-arabinose transferase-like glycosyltransferase
VATVAAVWAGGRLLVSRPAALVAAALAALNPFLIWYSQEARAYALLALLCATSFWLFARALRSSGRARDLAWWAVASVLAVATHYFAAFVVVPEAVALALLAGRTRAWAIACGAIGAAGVALAPLAAKQGGRGGADWISDIGLGHRIAEIPKRFVAGEFGNQLGYVFWPILLIVLAALALLLLRGREDERRGGLIAIAIGGAGLIVPIVLAVATLDYVFARNLIGSLPVLLVAFGAALTVAGARRLATGLAVLVLALSVLAVGRIATDDALQRDDWKSASSYLRERRVQALVISPAIEARTVSYYLGKLYNIVDPGVKTTQIAVVDLTRAPEGERSPPKPPPGWTVADVRDTDTYRLVLLRSPRPDVVGPGLALQVAARPGDVAAVADLAP